MGMLDDARRKMKDWTTTDENIQGSPKTKIQDLSAALAQLTPQERQRNIEHVKAYLDYYYVTHQGEKKIPVEVHKEFSKMVEQSNRLTAVENARIVLQQYGGAPTRDTLHESLERSANQRAKEFSQYRIEPITSREMSWRDLQPQQDRKQEQGQAQTQERTQTRAVEISHAPAPSVAPQARVETAPSLPPQTTPEPVKSVSQQAVMEPAKSTQQTIQESIKSTKEMSQDELRAKVKESIDQRLSGSESRQQRSGPAQEPSWKDLHPKQEQAQGQKQGKSQEHKHEQKQSRSRGKGMEISA